MGLYTDIRSERKYHENNVLQCWKNVIILVFYVETYVAYHFSLYLNLSIDIFKSVVIDHLYFVEMCF